MILMKPLQLVETPVFVEIAARTKRSESEDGLSTIEAPTCSSDVEAILDQMATCTLDDCQGSGIQVHPQFG